MTEWQKLQRATIRALGALLFLALLTFAADWAVWALRQSRGGGTDSLQVTRMVVAPLKGNREEFYMDGTEDRLCSRSLLPQGGNPPCWWLRRNRVHFER